MHSLNSTFKFLPLPFLCHSNSHTSTARFGVQRILNLRNGTSKRFRLASWVVGFSHSASTVVPGLEDQFVATEPHVPVLMKEVIGSFESRKVLSFVDCTLGAGGHAAAIIAAHAELETFVGLDVDPVAHAEAYPRLQRVIGKAGSSATVISRPTLHLIRTNFRNIRNVLTQVDTKLADDGVDGILMDLGMSSMQVNVGTRGFSFMRDGPTDMRMDPSANLKAEEILNSWPESEIGRILRDYGEERRWRYLARKFVEARLSGGISTTSQLVNIIGGRTKAGSFRQGRSKPSLHPATRTFQALRIAVNDELNTLELAIIDAFKCLRSGGRLAVISFHSLEDRIVKQFFLHAAGLQKSTCADSETDMDLENLQQHVHVPGETRYSKYIRKRMLESAEGLSISTKNIQEGSKARILTKRPIVASAEEMLFNPRCRSAKLRVIEKL